MRLTRCHLAFCFAGMLLAADAPAQSSDDVIIAMPKGGVQLTIRRDGAVVRERYEVNLSGRRDRVRFPGIPPEADPASLLIQDRFDDLKLLEWRVPSFRNTGSIQAQEKGRSVRVEFNRGDDYKRDGLEALFESRLAGERTFHVVYSVTGLSWNASYDVLLRGDLGAIGTRLSMDTDGWIEIINTTSRTFSNARVAVIGGDTYEQERADSKEPGILELDDDSPLADLWRDQAAEPRTPNIYGIRQPVTIPADASVMISHVSVQRKPVERVLLMRAEEIPTDTFTRFAKPSQIITFQNESDYGGDRAIPPGPALIHVGNQRSSIDQRAWFKHTAADGEIRIDMGKVEGIRGRRVNRGYITIPGGGVEQTFELRIENMLEQNVEVIIDEEPPVFNLAWDLVRANRSHEVDGQQLKFLAKVDGGETAIIQYTVRYALPEQ